MASEGASEPAAVIFLALLFASMLCKLQPPPPRPGFAVLPLDHLSGGRQFSAFCRQAWPVGFQQTGALAFVRPLRPRSLLRAPITEPRREFGRRRPPCSGLAKGLRVFPNTLLKTSSWDRRVFYDVVPWKNGSSFMKKMWTLEILSVALRLQWPAAHDFPHSVFPTKIRWKFPPASDRAFIAERRRGVRRRRCRLPTKGSGAARSGPRLLRDTRDTRERPGAPRSARVKSHVDMHRSAAAQEAPAPKVLSR